MLRFQKSYDTVKAKRGLTPPIPNPIVPPPYTPVQQPPAPNQTFQEPEGTCFYGKNEWSQGWQVIYKITVLPNEVLSVIVIGKKSSTGEEVSWGTYQLVKSQLGWQDSTNQKLLLTYEPSATLKMTHNAVELPSGQLSTTLTKECSRP